jgi:hypothetical protein
VKRNPADKPISDPTVYGRVAGVVDRSTFAGDITNLVESRGAPALSPSILEYAFNTKRSQTLGTTIDDAAPMAVRYNDAAYNSNGNYGAAFIIRGQFHNPTAARVRVCVFLDTPQEAAIPPAELGHTLSRSLRNTFEVKTATQPQPTYFHADERGDQPEGTRSRLPLVDVVLDPQESQSGQIRCFYAANNTPPHILRVVTLYAPVPGYASPAPPPQGSCPPGMIAQQLGDFTWCRHPPGWTRQ